MKPSNRVVVVGTTGSGKTDFALRLGRVTALKCPPIWRVIFLDSKRDLRDERLAETLGYKRTKLKDVKGSRDRLIYVPLESKNEGYPILEQAQQLFRYCYERRHVIIVVDEYTQCVPSEQNAGYWLKEIFQRGRGLYVGVIGCTQEPVKVPRLLFSQSSVRVFMNVEFPIDIKKLREWFGGYEPPFEAYGDEHGAFVKDYGKRWRYFSSLRDKF